MPIFSLRIKRYELRHLPGLLSNWERTLLFIFLAVLFFGTIGIIFESLRPKTTIATTGGTYVEGVTQDELDTILSRLTSANLVKFENGEFLPDLAESWQLNDEGTIYTFRLREKVDPGLILRTYETKAVLEGAEIQSGEPNEIKVVLEEPFSPILTVLARPIVPAGAYKIIESKSNQKNEVSLEANPDYFHQPFIKKVIIKIFRNSEDILKAATKDQIMGFASADSLPSFRSYKLKTQRYLILFFNLSRPKISDKNLRKKLVSGEKLDKSLSLKLVSAVSDATRAQEVKESLEKQGVEVTVILEDPKAIQKEVIPKRDFDLLIFGVDYGIDPDPYSFWHSSQAKSGSNISGFKNFSADKLLEEMRTVSDPLIQNEKYVAFQKILEEEAPAKVLEQVEFSYQVSDKVKGINAEILGGQEADRFLSFTKWYLKTKQVAKQ